MSKIYNGNIYCSYGLVDKLHEDVPLNIFGPIGGFNQVFNGDLQWLFVLLEERDFSDVWNELIGDIYKSSREFAEMTKVYLSMSAPVAFRIRIGINDANVPGYDSHVPFNIYYDLSLDAFCNSTEHDFYTSLVTFYNYVTFLLDARDNDTVGEEIGTNYLPELLFSKDMREAIGKPYFNEDKFKSAIDKMMK